MRVDLSAISGEIKKYPPNTREFLQAAVDANDATLMAMGICAHPSSLALTDKTISRLFVIGFLDGLPVPTEVAAMKTIAEILLDAEAKQ